MSGPGFVTVRLGGAEVAKWLARIGGHQGARSWRGHEHVEVELMVYGPAREVIALALDAVNAATDGLVDRAEAVEVTSHAHRPQETTA